MTESRKRRIIQDDDDDHDAEYEVAAAAASQRSRTSSAKNNSNGKVLLSTRQPFIDLPLPTYQPFLLFLYSFQRGRFFDLQFILSLIQTSSAKTPPCQLSINLVIHPLTLVLLHHFLACKEISPRCRIRGGRTRRRRRRGTRDPTRGTRG